MAKWMLIRKGGDFNKYAEKFQIDPLIVRLLFNRGAETEEAIYNYLGCDKESLHSPRKMKNMEKACQILWEKCKANKKIRVMGDYDIDGVCSTAILLKGLRLAGADVDAVIPHRMKDGYGLNCNMIENAKQDGVDTILTCDNGISAIEAIQKAKDYGMTVVVTDHHEVSYDEIEGSKHYILPDAECIVDPKQVDDEYPYKEICGGFVAYKLMSLFYDKSMLDWAWKIEKDYEHKQSNANKEDIDLLLKHWEKLESELLSLAAFATVGDIMPLCNENRTLVKLGLSIMNHTTNLGLRALIDVCGKHNDKLTAFHLGFILGPCLNATGRIDSADRALDLLMTEDMNEAMTLAGDLSAMNESRKTLTERGTKEAEKIIKEENYLEHKVFVIYLPNCHESVAGIIAGRIKEKYERPTFILTDAEGDFQEKMLKGSGRSVEAFHMYEAMTEIKELFYKYGGHAQAAGFSIYEKNLNDMRRKLNENCSLSKEDMKATLRIDADMPFSYCSPDVVDQLSILEPFGNGNGKPIFARRNLILRSAKIMGKTGSVGRYTVEDNDGKRYDLILFKKNEEFKELIRVKYGEEVAEQLYAKYHSGNDISFTAAYYPDWNEYLGKRSIQFIMTDFC